MWKGSGDHMSYGIIRKRWTEKATVIFCITLSSPDWHLLIILKNWRECFYKILCKNSLQTLFVEGAELVDLHILEMSIVVCF